MLHDRKSYLGAKTKEEEPNLLLHLLDEGAIHQYDPFSRPALAKSGIQLSQKSILQSNAEVDEEDKVNEAPDAYEDASSSLAH